MIEEGEAVVGERDRCDVIGLGWAVGSGRVHAWRAAQSYLTATAAGVGQLHSIGRGVLKSLAGRTVFLRDHQFIRCLLWIL